LKTIALTIIEPSSLLIEKMSKNEKNKKMYIKYKIFFICNNFIYCYM